MDGLPQRARKDRKRRIRTDEARVQGDWPDGDDDGESPGNGDGAGTGGDFGAGEAAGTDAAAAPPLKYRWVGRERERQYEYLDHTADVQLHGWGASREQALEETAIAMFDYMTPLDYIELDEAAEPVSGTVEGHDTLSLTFNFLDALLYRFATEDFVCKDVRVLSIEGSGEGDALLLKYSAWGAPFDLQRHPQGTEVKAITYSNMQVFQKEQVWHCFVIIDI